LVIAFNSNHFIFYLEVDLLENVVPLNLLEELIEEHTTSECENIFNYIEDRRAKITIVRTNHATRLLIILAYIDFCDRIWCPVEAKV
jgi:hypothetical protein